MKRVVFVLMVLLLVSCQAGTSPVPVDESAATEDAGVDGGEATGAIPAGEDDSYAFQPVDEDLGSDDLTEADLSVEVTGPAEIVFDWTSDRCEEENIPDIATRAFRDAAGNVQLWIGHYVDYRMIGPDLDHVVPDCTLLMRSDFDPDPSHFNDSEWLAAPYTEDGTTIYAIVHNEYRGDTHRAARPGQCPSGDRLTCLDTSVTMVVSTDGGDSYHDVLEPPNHMVATMPYVFNDRGVPSGLRQPSNIIHGKDGYFYLYTNISDYPPVEGQFPPQWVCAMRTTDPSDPASWRFWDGERFAGSFINPYLETVGPESPKCAPLELDDLSGSLNESVTYNTVLGRYLMMGYSYHPSATEPIWGIYFSLSDDLVHWTPRQLMMQIQGENAVDDPATDTFYAYPSLIDPDSPSMIFDISDGNAYLYITVFNKGVTLDRDLVRFPVQITAPSYPIPTSWRFESDGNEAGWHAANHLGSFAAQSGSLSMQSTGEDPYMVSAPLSIPAAEYNRIGIRMKVSGGGSTGGQLFFVTDADPDWDERKSLRFDVQSDNEYHDYELDLSAVESWAGEIRQLRLDPAEGEGRAIDIDIIAFIK